MREARVIRGTSKGHKVRQGSTLFDEWTGREKAGYGIEPGAQASHGQSGIMDARQRGSNVCQ
jgi:hypothetical protein